MNPAIRDHSWFSPLSQFEPTELFDSLSTGIVVLDAQLCPIYANVSAQDFMAVSLRQARGRPFSDLFYDPRQLLEVLRRSLTNLETCTQHELMLKAVGSAAHREPSLIDLIVTPLEGQVTGTYLLLELTDATQRQRISRDNEILADMDASRLMVKQLAHEVKNPLGGLRGAAQLLDKELNNPALREYTAVIIAEADRLVALVDSMVGGGGPPRKDHAQHPRAVRARGQADPRRSAARRADRARLRSEPSGCQLRPQPDRAGAAERGAQRACRRWASTARSWCARACAAACTSARSRHRLVAVIEVEDNGPGVPPDLIKTLFLPLVTGRSNGSGLGLAVAQDLATRHGGIIEFTSQPGRTVFSLLLPLEGVPGMSNTQLRVWLVDDDASIRWVLERALKNAGMAPRLFEAAESAIATLGSEVPDVLMTDIRMSGKSGLELLKNVHERHPELPVIVMTAHSDLGSAVSAYESGAFEYLPKPFDVDQAVDLVRRAAQAGVRVEREPRAAATDAGIAGQGAGDAAGIPRHRPAVALLGERAGDR